MNKISTTWLYVGSIHLTALFFMFLLRIFLYGFNIGFLENTPIQDGWILQAFLRGLWFDNIIASYISILPLVVLTIYAFFEKIEIPTKVANIYYIFFYVVVFAIGSADIAYFNYFFTHIGVSIFAWKEEGDVALWMMFQEPFYLLCFFIFIILCIVFIYSATHIWKKILRTKTSPLNKTQLKYYIPLFALIVFACYTGIRGRTASQPIRPSQAYFCTNSFLNQLGLNPSYFFLRSAYESKHKSNKMKANISDSDMIETMRSFLNIADSTEHKSPLYRQVVFATAPIQKNIIFIFMESMSHDYLELKGNDRELTPYLNQLKQKSIYFSNFYSAATHTNQGVFASLYGIPVLFDQNIMKNMEVTYAEGLPITLEQSKFHNLFFMTHRADYDNMNAFLLVNGFSEIHAQENYPESETVNIYGVPDDFLFKYALQELDSQANEKKPFLASILTVSNHPPFAIPKRYKEVSDNSEYQAVAFADDALGFFMEEAEKRSWFDNTIFVMVGDHGRIVGTPIYDMPLSYNHVPCMIYSKEIANNPQIIESIGGQIDLFPTIMGFLNIPYANNGFGVDLLNTKRKFISFNTDNMIGCIDDSLFYNYNLNTQQEFLFKYKDKCTKNYLKEYPTLVDSMRTYVHASYKMTDYMIENKLLRSN